MRQPGALPTSRASARATALVVGVCWLVGLAGAAPAAAHASLVRSSPADGSSMATAPKTVALTFDENIRMPSVIVVTDADGTSVVRGSASVVDNIVSTRVSIAASGNYNIAFRVVSADGHPVSGRLTFAVGAGSTGGPTGQVTAVTGPRQESNTPTGGTRVIGMLAALALLGGVGLLTIRRWAPNLWTKT